MAVNIKEIVKNAVGKHGSNVLNMLDIIRDVQADAGSISDEAIAGIAEALNVSGVDVEGVATFYHFFSKEPVGKYAVYLNNSAVSVMKGYKKIAGAFEKEAGCTFGSVTDDGLIGLFDTSCIGMNDQEPAAIINGTVFTNLTPEKVKNIVAGMKAGKSVQDLVENYGDGVNSSELKAMVNNNIRKSGSVLLKPFEKGSASGKAVSMDPEAVIEEIKKANLRGRGGAGFPTGMKWDFTRKAEGSPKYIICNADEGEPGTFKDRVLLTEYPEMVFEGMAVGGYAIGAEKGLIYLRAEYVYMKPYLEKVLEKMRSENLLGKNVAGKNGFNFDIDIVMGAGAYVCGEESALIESAEGKRGQPRNRPPFPAQKGFKDKPTSVNNVETFCSISRIMVEGADWFSSLGTLQSKGTKLLSVSGDCDKPGIYEIEFGTTLKTLLEECGGMKAVGVQVGGPSGECVGKSGFDRRLCFDDLATGGSIIVIGSESGIIETVHNFMDFFIEESCGYCVPCRAGNRIILERFEKIIKGRGTKEDLEELESWCGIVKTMSRCGLGQTSPNPVLTTIKNFPELYKAKLLKSGEYGATFDFDAAVKDSCEAAGRKPLAETH